MAKLFLVVLAFLAVASAEEWYHRRDLDCFSFLGVEKDSYQTSDIQRAVRRITARTHPDRCATPECKV
jgi:hypothetical protein